MSTVVKMAVDLYEHLRPDCSKCAGLCCIAPSFEQSDDFALDKPTGTRCPNLEDNFDCGIHPQLPERGFGGCVAFDCFGAGQQTVQVTFKGRNWLESPDTATSMFRVWTTMRALHETLWYLADALGRSETKKFHGALQRAWGRTYEATQAEATTIEHSRYRLLRWRTAMLFGRTSRAVRGGDIRPSYAEQDLSGQVMDSLDFRRGDLRGARFLEASLQFADLRQADVMGVDFRRCDIRGADLSDTLFLSQTQVNAAAGDRDTLLPPWINRPDHWRS